VVKINLKRDDGNNYMCTGYLIAPDVVATAGHCSYEKGQGRAISMDLWTGYHGRASTSSDQHVQHRRGVKIATTSQWIGSKMSNHDVAFVKLDSPFHGLTPYTYAQTPSHIAEEIVIAGYPGDKVDNGQKGADMWEGTDTANFDLNTSCQNMLVYKISTYNGKQELFESFQVHLTDHGNR